MIDQFVKNLFYAMNISQLILIEISNSSIVSGNINYIIHIYYDLLKL
jgi:hypothetical protein